MDAQHAVWQAIAASFDRTRSRPWPHVEAFLRGLPKGARVLDLMAGNGRHARVALDAGLDAVAVDWAAALLKKAGPGAVLADAVRLPFCDGSFDAAVYCAGLHGLPTQEGRRASLHELRRVLRPGASAQVTVWSRNAARFQALGDGPADVQVPWRADGHDQQRFYHLYTATELQQECLGAGFRSATILPAAGTGVTKENLVALLVA